MQKLRKTKAKRKLLAPDVLSDLHLKVSYGVPLSRAIRQAELNITPPVVTQLLKYWELKNNDSVQASLFPVWLDKHNTEVQQNPDNWYYVGRFPFGSWHYDEDN